MSVSAVIVAGGKGERMRAVSDQPKAMLPLDGRPLLEHQLVWLKAAGFSSATLCLGYKAEVISGYFGDGGRWGMSLSYAVERTPRGTAGAVKDCGVQGDVLVLYGDLFVRMDCRKLLDFHRAKPAAATLVVRETDHPLDSDLVDRQGEAVTRFYRAKAGEPHGALACAALWVVTPRLLELVPADRPSDFGREVFPAALAAGLPLRAYQTAEEILDLGTPERVAAFEKRRKAAK